MRTLPNQTLPGARVGKPPLIAQPRPGPSQDAAIVVDLAYRYLPLGKVRQPKGRGKPSALRPEGYAAENGAPHVAAVTLQRACATGRFMGVSSFFGLAHPASTF